MPVARVSRFGNLRSGLANLTRRKICQEKKDESVGRNVEIEIGKAVSEKSETRDEGRELKGRSKGSIGLIQAPERIEEKHSQEPKAAQTTNDARFSEAL